MAVCVCLCLKANSCEKKTFQQRFDWYFFQLKIHLLGFCLKKKLISSVREWKKSMKDDEKKFLSRWSSGIVVHNIYMVLILAHLLTKLFSLTKKKPVRWNDDEMWKGKKEIYASWHHLFHRCCLQLRFCSVFCFHLHFKNFAFPAKHNISEIWFGKVINNFCMLAVRCLLPFTYLMFCRKKHNT